MSHVMYYEGKKAPIYEIQSNFKLGVVNAFEKEGIDDD